MLPDSNAQLFYHLGRGSNVIGVMDQDARMASAVFYIRAAGWRARSARRPAVQNVSVIAKGHGGGHASPIEAAGQWFY